MMSYPTDLSDAEFRHIEEHFPAANQRGRPRIHAPRDSDRYRAYIKGEPVAIYGAATQNLVARV